MNLLHRWGLAVPLTILSLLFLGASVLNIGAYRSGDTTPQHVWTVVITALFAVSSGLSTDPKEPLLVAPGHAGPQRGLDPQSDPDQHDQPG